MLNNKVSIAELAKRLALQFNIAPDDAVLIVKATRDFFIENISAQNRILIRRFGSVKYTKVLPYESRNPQTGEKMITKAKYVARFTPVKSTIEYIDDK
ncbi:HU family DNA-binding protein [Shewanella sp. MBTL60-007]|uniref:HU family DNA-binding protein n=1 Tax=Shewanella sp. MBTL60-007 TaxID=2815911 RepID=UPI001BBA75D2|nr:HU family DNA-binding protein [Shewanella sp. MBTL60-007]GIU21743.1 hypothetical protein TUM3792_22890 [Shewanella sp. MBTL60-007]